VLLPSVRIIARYNVHFIEDEATGLGDDSDYDHANDTGAHHQAAEKSEQPKDEEMHSNEEQGAEKDIEDESVHENAPPQKKGRFYLPLTRATGWMSQAEFNFDPNLSIDLEPECEPRMTQV
jgi:hypothetical protein